MRFDGTFELNSPISKDDWDKLTDVELKRTKRIWFTTPNGKRVDYIRADVLDKIRAEIKGKYRVILKGTPKDDWAVRWNDCVDEVLEIINKYRESEDKE